MKQLKKTFFVLSTVIALLCCHGAVLGQTVNFTIEDNGDNTYEGCAPYLVTFIITIENLGGNTIDSVRADLDNGQFVTDDRWTKSGNTYQISRPFDPGKYNPTAEIYIKGQPVIKRSLPRQLVVYDLPTADFGVKSNKTVQCYNDNHFEFLDESSESPEGHEIVDWNWDFGDGYKGDRRKLQNPWHHYDRTGSVDVILTVVDEKGCHSTHIEQNAVFIYDEIGANFRVNGPVGCPCIPIRFVNTSKIDFDLVDKWVWDWGEGKAIDTFFSDNATHVDTAWTDFKRQYCRDGYHSPKLIIWTKDGCKDSITLVDAIRNIDVQFDITWVPDTPCFQNNAITFFMKPRPNATYFKWTFGDPASLNLNVDESSWSPTHSFVGGPGFYSVSLQVLEPPCGFFDTTLCYIKLKGPAAAIDLPRPSHTCVDPEEIPYRDFERLKYDECYRGNTGQETIEYMPVSNNRRVKDSTFFYCNAAVDSSLTISKYTLGGKDIDPEYNIGCADRPDIDTPKMDMYRFENPNPGVNGNWFYRYMDWTNLQAANSEWNYTDPIPVKYSINHIGTFSILRDVMFQIDTVTKNGKTAIRLDSIFFDVDDTSFTNRFNRRELEDSLILEGKHLMFNKGGIEEKEVDRTVFYKVGDYYYANKYIDITSGNAGKDSIFWSFGGSKTPQGDAVLRLYSPYLKVHKAWYGGRLYFARPESPIAIVKDNGKVGKYIPLMSPGTDPTRFECDDNWRGMHDSDKVKPNCAAPNLVKFTNQTIKYRLFGAGGSDVPLHKLYSWDNRASSALPFTNIVDACTDDPRHGNRNFPWASDSLLYIWDFGDASDQCTTYLDMNRDIAVKGDNPSGNYLECQYSELAAPEHLYTSDGCYTALLNVTDTISGCTSSSTQTIVMEQPNAGPADPRGPFFSEKDVNYYNQQTFQKDENNEDFREGLVLGRGAAPCVGNAANRYFQRIDISGTLPSCGRETFEMIFNREDDCQLMACDSLSAEIKETGSGHMPGEYAVRFAPFDANGNKLSVENYILGKAFIGDDSSLVHYQITEMGSGYLNAFEAKMEFLDSSQIGFNAQNDDPIELTLTQEVNFNLIISDRGTNLKPGRYAVRFPTNTAVKDTASGFIIIGDSGTLTEIEVLNYGEGYPTTMSSRLELVASIPAKDPNMKDQFGNVVKTLPMASLNSSWVATESYYNCDWISQNTLLALGMQWSYTSPGCKTPGLMIKSGDCLDTFFYEGYRYFLDANADALLSPHPQRLMYQEFSDNGNRRSGDFMNHIAASTRIACAAGTEETLPLKLPYNIVFSANDIMRNDPLLPTEDPVCDAADSMRNFVFTITQTVNNCGTRTNSVVRFDSLDMNTGQTDTVYMTDTSMVMENGKLKMRMKDTMVIRTFDPKLVNLYDTLHHKFLEPGKYTVATTARAMHGKDFCFGGAMQEFWIGQFQCYRQSDEVVCGDQDIEFIDSIRYWKQPGSIFCQLQSDPSSPYHTMNNPTCVDTGRYFYKPYWTRKAYMDIPGYEFPTQLEEVAWDFNAPRFNDDGSRMEDYQRVMDSSLIDIWDTIDSPMGVRDSLVIWNYAENGFGVGVYDVSLWAKDSLGCWTPFTVKNAVRVVGVEARFNLCSTCRDILVCTPAGAVFRDTSVVFEDPSIVPSGESVTKGVEDEIVRWVWDFGDGRDRSFKQHPLHNFIDPGTYDVKLVVESAQGCKDSLVKPKEVTVLAPRAEFELVNNEICPGEEVLIIDKSYGLEPGTENWTWTKGDGSAPINTNGEDSIYLTYNKPGTYEVSLRFSGKIYDPVSQVQANCEDQFPHPIYDVGVKMIVTVREVDSLKIDLSDRLICPGDEVIFQLDTAKSSNAYDKLFWRFGDEEVETDLDVELRRRFDELGTHIVRLSGEGDWPICHSVDSVEIEVKEVEAIIAIDSAASNLDLGNYRFLNHSRNAVHHLWEIYDLPENRLLHKNERDDYSPLEYTEFTKGEYQVILHVADDVDPDKACMDADTLRINVNPAFSIYNVFSPNGDGKNDWFEIELAAAPEYRLKIFNRWGEVIFEADQESHADCYEEGSGGRRLCKFWDGTNYRTQAPAPVGTYYYIFEYRFKGDDQLTPINGTITLLR